MAQFRGILMDLDNTLYDYVQAHTAALEEALRFLSSKVKISASELEEFYDKARDQIHDELKGKAASHNRLLYFQRMSEMMEENSLAHALKAYDVYWGTYIDNISLFEGVKEFLEKNSEKKICLVTDLTADIQHKKLNSLGLMKYFNYLVTSEEAGREKPAQEIFLLALKKLGCKANEVCMIGDDYEKDIKGAARLGIHAFWFNRSGQKKKLGENVVSFKDFNELLMLLD